MLATTAGWVVGTGVPAAVLVLLFGIRWGFRLERRIGELRERVVWLEAKLNGKPEDPAPRGRA